MLTIGALSFVVPWALAALLLLPVIWWLLRLTPPVPTIVRFPPVRLLFRLTTREESSAKTPLWLLLVRLALAAAVILAAAQPLLNAGARLTGKGPLVVIIDDGWAAAANWPVRRTTLAGFADHAEREGRPMVVLTTAPGERNVTANAVRLMAAPDARRQFNGLQPKPWPTARADALAPLLAQGALADSRPGDVVWLSDGIEEPDGKPLAEYLLPLQRLGAVTVIGDPPSRLAMVLRPPEADGGVLKLDVERPAAEGLASVQVRAVGDDGNLLARQKLTFAGGQTRAVADLTLPTELLNRLARLEIEDANTAGAVVLTDERWRRRPVGLVSGAGAGAQQPLLSDVYYLERALRPFTEIRRGSVSELLNRPLAVMVLADPGQMAAAVQRNLEDWIKSGGVAVRFAGPLLAKSTGDDAADPLLPVRLRVGDRVIGGSMSWSRPAKLASFEAASPFHGLAVPAEVTVRRQVLAQPALNLPEKTWARLDDGTPLVTAERRGKGWLVLVHTTANAEWSNLPLSGLFVDMLRRLVALSQGVAVKSSGPPLEPIATLDGFGRLGPAAAGARAIAADAFESAKATVTTPPGYYGDKSSRRALNLSAGLQRPRPIAALPSGVARAEYGRVSEVDFRPALLTLAMLLALIDLAASLALRGLLYIRRVVPLTALAVAMVGGSAGAADPETFALGNSLETRLAYVVTGNREIDDTSRAGLSGLNVILARRTAAELGPPQAVDPGSDELAFFPLLYWPVTSSSAAVTEKSRANINKYLRNGGTILFDTRSADAADMSSLRRLARGLDIPPLVPVPQDHVLTRAFYLIQEFPGRWGGGTLWVERAGERVNDGVSSVIAGSNDWAAAWAVDDAQRPIYPVIPGGERQREMAYRFGINLVMYTLTGNYKSDQVHIPAIMKRLSQ